MDNAIYKLLAGKSSYTAERRGIFVSLGWLSGSKNLLKIWNQLDDDDIMMIILSVGVQERLACEGWGDAQFKLSDPTSDEDTTWQVLNWRDFAEQRQPYDWPEGWPWPWATDEGRI